jgi:hypothetical protein
MFGCKSVLLGTLYPAARLSFQVHEIKEPRQGGVVGTPVQVFVEVFRRLHKGQKFLSVHAKVPLGLGQGPAVVRYYTLLALLNL